MFVALVSAGLWHRHTLCPRACAALGAEPAEPGSGDGTRRVDGDRTGTGALPSSGGWLGALHALVPAARSRLAWPSGAASGDTSGANRAAANRASCGEASTAASQMMAIVVIGAGIPATVERLSQVPVVADAATAGLPAMRETSCGVSSRRSEAWSQLSETSFAVALAAAPFGTAADAAPEARAAPTSEEEAAQILSNMNIPRVTRSVALEIGLPSARQTSSRSGGSSDRCSDCYSGRASSRHLLSCVLPSHDEGIRQRHLERLASARDGGAHHGALPSVSEIPSVNALAAPAASMRDDTGATHDSTPPDTPPSEEMRI